MSHTTYVSAEARNDIKIQACKKILKEISNKFKLIDVHHRLYPNEKFATRDSLEDVKALKRVFLHPLCSRELNNEVISNSRQLPSIRRKASFDKSTKIIIKRTKNFQLFKA